MFIAEEKSRINWRAFYKRLMEVFAIGAMVVIFGFTFNWIRVSPLEPASTSDLESLERWMQVGSPDREYVRLRVEQFLEPEWLDEIEGGYITKREFRVLLSEVTTRREERARRDAEMAQRELRDRMR